MISDQWQKVKELFDAAMKHSPDERRRFVGENCSSDEAVRREVESLLANAEDAAAFLEQPAVGEVAEAIVGNNEKLHASQNLNHYKILKLIGEGGMGEVYLAEDTHLNRKVALKLLAAHITEDETKVSRFRQEAFATSALNHPNILTIYEIGNWQNRNFIATEFIDGMTLRSLLQKKKLSIGEILDIALQSASALEAAHGAGIVHRDIKPENIMIRPDGLVKILDFGIAKYMPSKDGRKSLVETEVGEVIGTAAYMSPEQARGLEIDSQTDIWSLGVILYEMIARKLPFPGKTKSDRIAAILEHEPAPLTKTNRRVSPPLQQIVDRALAKNKKERYAEMTEMTKDLHLLRETTGDKPPSSFFLPVRKSGASRRTRLFAVFALIMLLVGAVGLGYWFLANRPTDKKQIESIAVMPFINEGGNADVEYLSDGMTETLISSLSQLPNLNVKARSSVFRYKGKETNIQTIGKELNVQAILNGRVVERGGNLSLYVELVDVAADKVIWSQTYNRPMMNLVALQSEIARDVSGNLQTKLSGADEKKLAKNYTENAEAYQLYLKGNYHWNKHTLEDLHKGIEYFNQAIEKDPNYALAYAGLSGSYGVLGNNYLPPNEAFPKSKAYAAKALEIDDTLSEAHTAMAAVNLFYDWDRAEAEKHLQRARTLSPNVASVSDIYSAYWDATGQPDKALAESKRGQELEPLSPLLNANLGLDFYFARQYDEAITQCEKTVNLEPRYYNAYLCLGQAYEQKKMYKEAIATYQKGMAQSERNPKLLASLGHAYALESERDKALKTLDELREISKRQYVSPYLFAVVYLGLGDKEQTFAQLDKAFQDRSFFLIWLKVEPLFDSLRGDPRFADLLRRIGL